MHCFVSLIRFSGKGVLCTVCLAVHNTPFSGFSSLFSFFCSFLPSSLYPALLSTEEINVKEKEKRFFFLDVRPPLALRVSAITDSAQSGPPPARLS